MILPGAALATAVVFAGVEPVVKLVTSPGIVIGAVLGSVVAFVLVNLWEEAAWTGFALERLQPRLGPIGASVVTTWLQALIHLPLVFIAGGVTDGRVAPEQVPFYLVALFILPIPVRIILTWLYNRTGRSVPIVALAHAGLGSRPAAPSSRCWRRPSTRFVFAGFAVLATVVLIATRGRLGLAPGASVERIHGEAAMAS